MLFFFYVVHLCELITAPWRMSWGRNRHRDAAFRPQFSHITVLSREWAIASTRKIWYLITYFRGGKHWQHDDVEPHGICFEFLPELWVTFWSWHTKSLIELWTGVIHFVKFNCVNESFYPNVVRSIWSQCVSAVFEESVCECVQTCRLPDLC